MALVALIPALDPHRVALDMACPGVLMLVNLCGVRAAGALFVLPTYILIGSLAVLLGWGCCASPRAGSRPYTRPLSWVGVHGQGNAGRMGAVV